MKKNILKILLIYCLVMNVSMGLFAQEQKSQLKIADEYYTREEFSVAAKMYHAIYLKGKQKDISLIRKLANCYREINRYGEAEKWYAIIAASGHATEDDWVYQGQLLKNKGDYEQARVAFNNALNKGENSINELIKVYLAGCDSAVKWKDEKSLYQINNFGLVNTRYSDWGAAFYGGKSFVYTSDSLRNLVLKNGSETNAQLFGRTNQPFQKLYLYNANKNKVEDFSDKLNGLKYHIGPACFSKNRDTVYYTVTDAENIVYQKENNVNGKTILTGIRRLKIYVNIKDKEGNWGKPTEFEWNKPDEYSVGNAALSKDNKTLYFTSDMSGGYGKTDIWYSERLKNGKWGRPVNCGPLINTADEEDFSVINDDSYLYFSSKGIAGLGGYDIFMARGNTNRWGAPQNMKAPINSAADDFYFSAADGFSGYFSSNRDGGKGEDDVYTYSISPPVNQNNILQITVFDKNTKRPINMAEIVLAERSKKEKQVFTTNIKGEVFTKLNSSAKYSIEVSMLCYDTLKQGVTNVNVRKNDTLKIRVFLEPDKMLPGTLFTLHNINFDFDKADLRQESEKTLDQLIEILLIYPSLKIELAAHTDAFGGDEYNLILSQKRAEVCVNYLVSKKLLRDRFYAKGYGRKFPIARETLPDGSDNPKGRQINRRVEFIILENKVN